jgi:acetyltransferase-like isoleucine patch superfamily enzyme
MLNRLLKRLRAKPVRPLPPPPQDPTIRPDAEGNRVRMPDGLVCHVTMEGTGNYLDIQGPTNIGHLQIHLGGNAHVVIGPHCVLPSTQIHTCRGAAVQIGGHTAAVGYVGMFAHEPAQIILGADCLLAGEVVFAASDAHAIYDAKTGKRINPARDILVGEHVWLGSKVRIHKGARIGKGTMIGANAIVTGRIPENCVAAGAPARVVRRGIRWSRELA